MISRQVKLAVGHNVVVDVTVTADNGVLFTMAADIASVGNASVGNVSVAEVFDLRQLLSTVADDAITLYVSSLRGQEVYIVNRTTLLDCLKVYSLTEDKIFLIAVIKQLFLLWTVLSPVLYSNCVDDNVLRDVFLHCPYQLLPDWTVEQSNKYSNNQHFMAEWLARDDNKKVVINGSELLTYKDSKLQVAVNNAVTVNTVNNCGDCGDDEDDQRGLVLKYTRSDKLQLTCRVESLEIGAFKQQSFAKLSRAGNILASIGIYSSRIADIFDKQLVLAGNKQGPYCRYYKGVLSNSSYYLDNKEVGDEISYFASGRVEKVASRTSNQSTNQLSNQTISGWKVNYYLDEPQHRLSKSERLCPRRSVTDRKVYISNNPFSLHNGYIEHYYSSSRRVKTATPSVRLPPVSNGIRCFTYLDSLSFLDKEGKVMRTITGLGMDQEKSDSYYDSQGEVSQLRTYTACWYYDGDEDCWSIPTATTATN